MVFCKMVFMPSQVFELADRVVGGRLGFLLHRWRSEGLTLPQIAGRLAEEHDIHVTDRTIANWLRRLDAESQEQAS